MAISIHFANERIAVIQSVKGEVRIYSKNKSKPAAVAIIGRSILENDIIRTSSNGECVILYEDRKTYLHLGNQTEIQFIESLLTRTMNVNYGNVFFYQSEKPLKQLYIFTLASQINIPFGKIWLSSNLSGDDEVYILEDTIQVYNEISAKGLNVPPNHVSFSTLDGYFEIVKYKKENLPDYVKKYLNQQIQLEEFEKISFESLKKVKLRDWDLIPRNVINKDDFIEPLDEGFKYKIGIGGVGVSNEMFIKLVILPYYHMGRFRAGMDLSGYVSSQNNISLNFWSDLYDLIDKIAYMDYFDPDGKMYIHMGDISNITFGYGGLVRNYTNTQANPRIQRTGIMGDYVIGDNFVEIEGFISDFNDFKSSGGLMGMRGEIFISNNLPLTIGLSSVFDINQFSSLPSKTDFWESLEDTSGNTIIRNFYGLGLDLSYEILDSYDYGINFYSETVGLWYPEKRQFSREFRDIRRDGSWGLSFPGVNVRYRDYFNISTAFHYNSSLYTPNYFNTTYDLERTRNIMFNENVDEEGIMLNNMLAYYNLIYFDTVIGDTTGNLHSLILTKYLQSIVDDTQNKYNTSVYSVEINSKLS